ncbi:Tfp pilus assembly protein PilN [Candidatus Regiella insecticola 5.15]|uniref:Tfp pilus assembly protein PilN n=2 Tax=Candidatus Regiella insecticola TaxID=138073 RepID=G2GYM0_9ENTR|nr:Tfp pilus assembly protein PilN [Candidatus Regiella insecticola 5.15]
MFQVNFLPWRTRQLMSRYHFWLNLFFLQSVIIIVGIMLIFLLWKNEHLQHQITLIQLLQQQKVLQTIYLATQKKAKLLQNIKIRNKNHQHIQQQTKNYLMLLQRLSRLIPENCWLLRLEQQGNLFVFDGISNNYTAIITFLRKLAAEDSLFNIQLHNINQNQEGKLYFVIHAKGLYQEYSLQKRNINE